MKIHLPDGNVRELPDGATAYNLAQAIGPKLAQVALAAKTNGKAVDLFTPLKDEDTVEILTFESNEGKAIFHHSSSHILAQAVQELYPDAKIAIGPSI